MKETYKVAALGLPDVSLAPELAARLAAIEPFADLAALLAALRQEMRHIVVVDMGRADVARGLDKLHAQIERTEQAPCLVILGGADGQPSGPGTRAARWVVARGAPAASLSCALAGAVAHLDLATQVASLESEITELREKALRESTIARERRDKIARLERRVFDFFTLSQVGKALVSIPGLRDLSRVFLSMVKEVYDSTNCTLLLYDDTRQAFVLQDCLGLERDALGDLTLEIREGLFWQLLHAGEPFPIIDSAGSYRFEQLIRKHRLDLLHSELWVPMKVRNSLVGILTVGSKPDGQPYHSEERSYIAQLTNHATVAFESARLNIQKELATKELHKKMENLSILYSVSKAMNFMNDLKKVLMMILDKAVEAVEAQKASLMLLNEDTGELVVNVVRGVPPEIERKINSGELETQKIKVGDGIAGKVAATRKPILIDDVSKSAEFAEPNRSYVDSILCVPLVASDECIGVINVTNKKSGAKFSQDDLDIMNTLAGQAAVTIHNAKLYYLAITDGMTQLHIHRYFQQRLKEELVRATRFKHPTSLIMGDIDHFKHFNDTYGHQQGDLVLMTVARLIRTGIREVDIPARYGGEEFAVVCPETTREEAGILAERLRRKIEDVSVPGPQGPIKVTISFGVAAFPEDAKNREDLIKEADKALYKAKEEGRNRVALSIGAPPAAAADTPARPQSGLEGVEIKGSATGESE